MVHIHWIPLWQPWGQGSRLCNFCWALAAWGNAAWEPRDPGIRYRDGVSYLGHLGWRIHRFNRWYDENFHKLGDITQKKSENSGYITTYNWNCTPKSPSTVSWRHANTSQLSYPHLVHCLWVLQSSHMSQSSSRAFERVLTQGSKKSHQCFTGTLYPFNCFNISLR